MFLINENYEPIKKINKENIKKQFFWTYDINKKDFFIKSTEKWNSITSPAYKIRIDKTEVYIPSNFFIIIGDFDIGLDIIMPKEITGREFEALTYNKNINLTSMNYTNMEIVGYKKEESFLFPFVINNLILISFGNKLALVSSKNIYSKVKKLTNDDFM